MPDSQAIVQSAQLASLSGLSNCLAVLFGARQSLGDMVFTFAEGGEERAHRCVVGCAAIVWRQTEPLGQRLLQQRHARTPARASRT